MLNKEEGIIIEYDGYIGKIKTVDKEYLLQKKNIKNNQELKVGDTVSFLGEEVLLIDGIGYIATFVDVI